MANGLLMSVPLNPEPAAPAILALAAMPAPWTCGEAIVCGFAAGGIGGGGGGLGIEGLKRPMSDYLKGSYSEV